MELIDGKIVWELYATYGVPLEVIIPRLAEENVIPTWDTLLNYAEKDGANLSRLINRLKDLIEDSYSEHEIINKKMGALLNWRNR